jgi:hypothetical protein
MVFTLRTLLFINTFLGNLSIVGMVNNIFRLVGFPIYDPLLVDI